MTLRERKWVFLCHSAFLHGCIRVCMYIYKCVCMYVCARGDNFRQVTKEEEEAKKKELWFKVTKLVLAWVCNCRIVVDGYFPWNYFDFGMPSLNCLTSMNCCKVAATFANAERHYSWTIMLMMYRANVYWIHRQQR